MKNDPTFPILHANVEKYMRGLTKREYFAGLAMMNLQNVLMRKSNAALMEVYRDAFEEKDDPAIIAELAVEQADALIAALEAE